MYSECDVLVPDNIEFDFGYFKCGRGSAQVWIKLCMKPMSMNLRLACGVKDQDGATSVGNARKQKLPDAQGSKCQVIRDEFENIFTSLKEKHSSTHNAAQLRLWINIPIGTHWDYDEPHKVPKFGIAKTGT